MNRHVYWYLLLLTSTCIRPVTQQEWLQQATANAQQAETLANQIKDAVNSGKSLPTDLYRQQDALNASMATHAFVKPSLQKNEDTWRQLQAYFSKAVNKGMTTEQARKHRDAYFMALATKVSK